MTTFSDHGIEIPNNASGHIRTTCPECSADRNKSDDRCLSVEVGKGVWYCHHCGISGGLKDETRKEVCEHFEVPEYKPSGLPQNVIDWFADRGIPEPVLSANQIGFGKSFKDANGIMFPYFKLGIAVNVKHRTGDKRFRQEKNAEQCLYRYDKLNGKNKIIICEGEMDALSWEAAGINYATSVPDGAPSPDARTFNSKFKFLEGASHILDQCEKIFIAVDNDPPGKKLEAELSRRIGLEKCWRVTFPAGCKDSNDVLTKHGKDELLKCLECAAPYPIDGLYQPGDYRQEMLNLYDMGVNRGVSTGWKSLDPYYNIRPCEMSIITGIPGSGKSTWLDNVMINLVQQHDWKFAVFSPENWPVERHIQSLLEKFELQPFAAHGHHTERMKREDVPELIDVINDNFYFIYPKDLLTVDTILDLARAAIRRYGANGVVIDPWNEIDHLFEGMNEAQYLSKALSKMRQFARKHRVHIWVVAHPRNLVKAEDGTYKPPTMYEISGGAHWRNKADNGICIHRMKMDEDRVRVYVQKIRFREVGKVGDVDLKYSRDTGTFNE